VQEAVLTLPVHVVLRRDPELYTLGLRSRDPAPSRQSQGYGGGYLGQLDVSIFASKGRLS
jgi:hypothetical protein